VSATQHDVTQVVISTRTLWSGIGLIYLAGLLVLALLTLVLIPNIAQLAERVGQDGTRSWPTP
jgi:competence protein ComGC